MVDATAPSTNEPCPATSRAAQPGIGNRLSGYTALSRTTIHGYPAALFGLAFAIPGGIIVLVGLGMIPVDESTIHAPRWIVTLAGGLFLITGLWLILHGVLGILRLARLDSNRLTRPAEPWLWDYPWAAGRIPSREVMSLAHHVFGLLVMGGLVAMLNWWAFAIDGPLMVKIIAVMMDSIGLLVLFQVARRVLARLKHGTPYLAFEPLPIRPGESFEAKLACSRSLERANQIKCVLRFVQEQYETTGRGENRRQDVVCYEQYRDEITIDDISPHRPPAAGSFTIRFNIPSDARGNDLRSRPAAFWDLEIEADCPGVDFLHRFLVPVYPDR